MSRICERANIAVCVWIALIILFAVDRAEGSSDNESKLLKLAMKKFPCLTKDKKELEKLKKLSNAVANGQIADYSDELGKYNDPNEAEDRDPNTGILKWDPNTRAIRAKCIEWLCTDPNASAMVTHKGIWIKGARVDGVLNLQYARIPFPLYFEKSAFTGGIYLQISEIRFFGLPGTHTGPIYGSGLKTTSAVFLCDGFKAEGKVRLVGATIDGDLNCAGGQFIDPNGTAFSADGVHVSGRISLCHGFKAEGEVTLVGANIGGYLDCTGGQFIDPNGTALSADGVHVSGKVSLCHGFKAEGDVRLLNATIGGDLNCAGGQFIDPNGFALSADKVHVSGDVSLCHGFKAEGDVRLLNATIDGDLNCAGGQFIDPNRTALGAEGVHVSGRVFLCNGFRAEGKVELLGAIVDDYFVWRYVKSPEGVTLDLRSASIGTLWDDKKSWPDNDKLFLHGLVYQEIFDKAPRDADSRINWLRRQEGFWPQPYEQLAAVLRKGGQDEDARKILIAKNEEKAGLKTLTRSEKIWYRILGPMIGYGYRPLKALWGVLFLVVLGWLLFGKGYQCGLLSPESDSAFAKGDKGIAIPGDERKLSDVYPKFNFLIYSADTFVPLIDLHQSKYWLPNANRGPELFNIKGVSLHLGGLLRLYLWIHIAMGWVLSTLLVVGLTGLVRT